jgi:hypothetical protein
MVNTSETLVTSVEGPKGTAEVVEIVNPQTHQAEYQVRYKGTVETYRSMGEAYITAKEKADYKG